MNTLSEQELIDVFTGAAGARREREKLDDDGDDTEQSSTKTAPTAIDPKAFIGPAGKFVETLAPHTEAAPESLLFQFLPCVGALLGRGPHIMAGGSRHGVNLFSVVVGPTASGRKGTARGLVERAVRLADPDFARENIVSGLSSGEGIIHHIRDPIEKTVPVREKGRHTGEYETVIEDQGVSDKRVGIFEPEFSRVLKAASRDGSVLSEILRLAWDSRDLRVITKTCAETATDPHISLIAHVTAAELRETLAKIEFSNGAGNRYLWTLSQRSKLLPLDNSINDGLLEPVAGELRLARDFWIGNTQPTIFSADAREKWIAVYPALTADRDGVAGGLLARAEAQVLRLALLYSALDCAREIHTEHLSAALACWEYVESSVREIFGNMVGKPAADQILDALLADSKRGLSRTQISAIFARHLMATVIESALGELEVCGKARCERTPTAGRPREVWYAIETAK